ncbi:YcfL family protein [Testudinibacter sp. P80/BLE/0925]|uniref:YcfL family protein n=1 Tax=Testudinibacter sp. TW-1 TaxID=3417757 RepID=UPI003D35FC26
MKRFLLIMFGSAMLAACSSAPPRYLADSEPIVNIDAGVAAAIEVKAGAEQVGLTNISQRLLALQYQITWYDKDGVTQLKDWSQLPQWVQLALPPQQREIIGLEKPTRNSSNYRIYIKGH